MSIAAQVQALLRFLTSDARIPLAQAMGKVKELQKANLINPEDILKADLTTLQSALGSEKVAKQVLNAAKRVSKKRPNEGGITLPSKKSRKADPLLELSPYEFEQSLVLPVSEDVGEISTTRLVTNRAPLMLAFAVTVLKYTMPEQPLSSRLSLAQAVVSANSRTKAVSLGIESQGADDEDWIQGQPTMKVLGREITVLKRWGYGWRGERVNESSDSPVAVVNSGTVADTSTTDPEEPPALWGLDLGALGRSNGPVIGSQQGNGSGLPIYRAESARDYLLRAFTFYHEPDAGNDKKTKKKNAIDDSSAKANALSLVLGAIDLLCQSWACTLTRDELDRRAWAWYVRVRPEVQDGVRGWGQKGKVNLSDILDLRR
ncbi:hypothetical protein AJ80_09461 [Polytolypa hystricis UAMH7299]|uniref:Impact N-terminal domain-containing protein n=1 Tax=Polytolypa hystricis (strain UAMH7299) TaxID=1447883 RepID=A0A2B7WQA2_POLH7|nr:hypothetical protein AJ80_09461 [Polytolypa hystricis UAMH7299]